jgi:hypothetical protein
MKTLGKGMFDSEISFRLTGSITGPCNHRVTRGSGFVSS